MIQSVGNRVRLDSCILSTATVAAAARPAAAAAVAPTAEGRCGGSVAHSHTRTRRSSMRRQSWRRRRASRARRSEQRASSATVRVP